jgi:hypothetical protein
MSPYEPRSPFIFDIETAINERAEAHLKSVDLGDLGYDGRIKDPEKIEANKKERIVEARAKLLDKAPLSWWYGRIVSIAVVEADLVIPEVQVFSARDLSERSILNKFFAYVQETAKDGAPLLIGKNSSSFDNGYLIGRCICLDMGIPSWLRPSRQIDDIDQIFSFKSGAATTGKLSEYAFGIAMEKLASGADVAAMVKEERWDDLEKYNKHDVLLTGEIYSRYLKEWRP